MGEVVVKVRLGWVGDGEGDWCGGEGGAGPGSEGGVFVFVLLLLLSSSSFSSTGRGGRGAGRCGLRRVAVEAERFLVVLSGKGTGLSSIGGGRMGAPGKSTLWLWVRMRAMMVLALADVSSSLSMANRVARGVDEPECSPGEVSSGLYMLTS